MNKAIFVDNGIRPYFAQTIILSLIPIVFSLIAIFYWCLVYYIEYGKEAFVDSFYKREISNKLTVSIIIMLFTLLPKIVDLTLRAYKCVNLGDDDNPIYFLKADYDIQCWESNHWYFIVFVAVPSLLIWGIVCPMQLFHFFHEKKEKLFEKEYIEAYGFLLRGYTKRSISNEFIIFYRKMILIIIAIYVDYSSQTQVLMAFGVLVLSLTYHKQKQPYSDVVFNDLETKNLLCQCIVLISLLYITSASDLFVQVLFLLILLSSYAVFIGTAIYFYAKETVLDILQKLYNNVSLYNVMKEVGEKFKIGLLMKLSVIFKEKFLPLDYDHTKEMNRMFQYLEQNSNLMDENFAKTDEFANLKRDSKVKLGIRKKMIEVKEAKKKQRKLKKLEKQREKHGLEQIGQNKQSFVDQHGTDRHVTDRQISAKDKEIEVEMTDLNKQ